MDNTDILVYEFIAILMYGFLVLSFAYWQILKEEKAKKELEQKNIV